jgi:hypothetical protein
MSGLRSRSPAREIAVPLPAKRRVSDPPAKAARDTICACWKLLASNPELAHEVFDLLFVQRARDELACSGNDLVIEAGATASGAEQETAGVRLPNADENQAKLVALERKKGILDGHGGVSPDRGGPVAMTPERDLKQSQGHSCNH